ncbi:MAG: tRNA (5-methylaminomethyl-2-thiouridine)(34)-methyltransferase MnmD [Flavobacteriales bacterium]|nr:tRNA (5-methylaminomethyl-2-thiouridine)(34)-methyltransferase MnmD [Flavobacteriales bacterium]
MKVVITGDGSPTLVNAHGDSYKSLHGARCESTYVFIQAGLQCSIQHGGASEIFEVGFGTGLNALLTAQYANENNLKLNYTTIEAFPLADEWKGLDYGDEDLLSKLHQAEWEEPIAIDDNFSIIKREAQLQTLILPDNRYDVVYYDAFGPRAQPELWSLECFQKLFKAMNKAGVLVTYCVKGDVRRNMIAAGFNVERMAGPPGKRHMLRAIKPL